MKLRNKKTGEIVEAESCNSTTGTIGIFYETKNGEIGTKGCFETLTELNEEWEDYIPPEPLIEKKFHKAIRAWFEANNRTTCLYNKAKDCIYFKYSSDIDISDTSVCLSFLQYDAFDKLEHRKLYNITQLCGLEE